MGEQVFKLIVLIKDFHSIMKVRDLILRGKCLEILKDVKVNQGANVVYDLSLGFLLEGQTVVEHSVNKIEVEILVKR